LIQELQPKAAVPEHSLETTKDDMLVLTVALPELESVEDVDLKVSESQVSIEHAFYKLTLALPCR
jgi:HSP20 family molecular chaperone IbpA